MSEEITIEMKGVQSVLSALDMFSARIQRNVITRALFMSAKVIADAVRKNTPKRMDGKAKRYSAGTRYPGFLQRSVGAFKQKKGVPRGRISFLAGPGQKGYYRHMVEGGHIIGKRLSKGRSKAGRASVAAHPFIQPAYNQSYNAALSVFDEEFSRGVMIAAVEADLKARKNK